MCYVRFTCALLFLSPCIFLKHFSNATLTTHAKINQILSFMEINGKRHLSLTTFDNYDLSVLEFQIKFIEMSKTKNLYTNHIITLEEGQSAVSKVAEKLDYYKDSLVIIASSQDSNNWDSYFTLLEKVKVMSATMIFPEPLSNVQFDLIRSKLEVTETSRHFYLIMEDYEQGSEISYKRIITLSNVKQVVVDQVSFNEFGHIQDIYDLQGMQVLSTTVSWPPYIFLPEECKERKRNNPKCKPYGHLVDTLNAMGKIANFTWECDGDPNDSYGTTPISGPANENGTWGAVVGEVFDGTYHFSMSTWVWKEERQNMFDFATIVTDQTALAITLKAKEIDYTLFTRPFRLESWLLVGFAVIIFLLATLVPFLFAPDFGESTSYRLIEVIAFTFFMLTEIYYSGALTMFFSTAPTLPFETMEQVMREYPTWKLMMRAGNDVYYVYKVQDGDPDYVAFWDRVTNEPEEAVFKAVGEGMDKVLNGFYVAQMQEGSIKGWIRDNPIRGDKVKIFGRGRTSYYTLILTNNSPIGRVFSSSTRQLIERGITDRINTNWLERKKTSVIADLDSTLIVLKPGQMILIYFLVFLMIVSTMAVFVIEHIWRACGGDKFRKDIEKKMEENPYLNMG